MAESSLSLQLADFAAALGTYLGFGRTPANWTGWNAASPYAVASTALDTQLAQIMDCVQGGLRQFYDPPLAEPAAAAHKWSFLTPQRSLTTSAGKGVYDLPDDYGGIEGELTYQPTDSTWLTVQRVGPGQIDRYLQQLFGVQGKPQSCCVLPKPSDGVVGQRWSISFAPLPDGVYTLTFAMRVLPSALSATNPFPYGGERHGETIMASCLAIAERNYQDESQGNQWTYFMERLKASISADIRDSRPAFLGYNGDRSDGREGSGAVNPYATNTLTTGVTFNGIQY